MVSKSCLCRNASCFLLFIILLLLLLLLVVVVVLVGDSSVGMATGWKALVRFPTVQDYSPHSDRADFVAHLASYVVGTGALFPGGKAAGA
jgi:hypothetical protein